MRLWSLISVRFHEQTISPWTSSSESDGPPLRGTVGFNPHVSTLWGDGRAAGCHEPPHSRYQSPRYPLMYGYKADNGIITWGEIILDVPLWHTCTICDFAARYLMWIIFVLYQEFQSNSEFGLWQRGSLEKGTSHCSYLICIHLVYSQKYKSLRYDTFYWKYTTSVLQRFQTLKNISKGQWSIPLERSAKLSPNPYIRKLGARKWAPLPLDGAPNGISLILGSVEVLAMRHIWPCHPVEKDFFYNCWNSLELEAYH